MQTLYIYIDTSNELLLPLAVADSASQLAKMIGTTKVNILSSIYHAKQRKEVELAGGRKYKGTTICPYEKIIIEEEDDECLEV